METSLILTEEFREEESTSLTTSTRGDAPEVDIDPAKLPNPMGWMLLVKPVRPKSFAGSIALTDDTVEAQEVFNYVNRVIKVGPLAFKARTTSGLLLSEQEIPKPGDWIVMPYHVGQQIRVHNAADPTDTGIYKIIKDTDVLAIVPDHDILWTWIKA